MEDEEFFDLLELVDRFNKSLKHQKPKYFDIDQFEAIADYYTELGKPEKAIRAINMGLEQHPYHTHFALRKVNILTASNQVKEATAEIEKLEKSAPLSYDLFMARAALQSKVGKHHQAIQYYRKALGVCEFPEEVWCLLAMEYQMLGHFELAIKYHKMALEEMPEDEIGVYNIALCYDLVDKPEEGIVFFEKFIDSNPYSEVAWYHLGIIQAKVKNYDRAIWALDYALVIDEFFSAAYFEKARLLEKTYRFKEATEVYKETFYINGPTGFAYYKIGSCFLQMHNRKKALSYFTKAIHEDEDLDEAFFELALMKDEDQQWEEAMYMINKALELDPDNIEYMCISADIHRRAGRLDEAEVLYEQILDLEVAEPMIFIDYAELLFDMCEFDNGMELLYKGVEKNPQSADMHYRLAGYLYTLQENDEADIYLKKALLIDADRRMHFLELFPQLKKHKAIKAIFSGLKVKR